MLHFFWNFQKFSQTLQNSVKFCTILQNLLARRWFSCRAWKMLKNAYLDAKIGVDPAENEPRKEWWCPGHHKMASDGGLAWGVPQALEAPRKRVCPIRLPGLRPRDLAAETFLSFRFDSWPFCWEEQMSKDLIKKGKLHKLRKALFRAEADNATKHTHS